MSEWTIAAPEYFERIELGAKEFKRQLQLPDMEAVTEIVPLRSLKTIASPPIPISHELLAHLIRHIKTLDGRMPFPRAQLQMVKVDPRQLKIGQRFVYRENYQRLLEELPDIFHRYAMAGGGLSDLGACFVFGFDEDGKYSLACYLPPLIEDHGNGDGLVIMDGIHRNFTVRQAGGTINAVILRQVDLPFPCGPRSWSEIKVIPLADKPKDVNERYFDLQIGLFRDLKYLGIDG